MVWIEIICLSIYCLALKVTTLVVVWIEMRVNAGFALPLPRHHSRSGVDRKSVG